VAAPGSVGRVVTAGAVRRRPTSGCIGRRAFTLFRSFERRRAAPVNLGVRCLEVLTIRTRDENQMRVVKQVLAKRLQVGGQEHFGWLPPSASQPLAIQKEQGFVDVRILEDVGGFILEFEYQNSSAANDSWHSTISEAENEAEMKFGIAPSDWDSLSSADI
jgi:hypothetical protein